LRFFGDLSLAEIALETGRPVATIKTHLRRGLLRLRSDAVDLRFDQ
jgi:DNA-directed RNA polymerase specialized sigma24 family protein